MFRLNLKKRAQTTLEYAILIGVIVGALIAMQTYIKRGYQGKLRESADSMGEQFSPGYSTYTYTTKSKTDSNEKTEKGTSTTTLKEQSTDKSGSETVPGANDEYWFNK